MYTKLRHYRALCCHSKKDGGGQFCLTVTGFSLPDAWRAAAKLYDQTRIIRVEEAPQPDAPTARFATTGERNERDGDTVTKPITYRL